MVVVPLLDRTMNLRWIYAMTVNSKKFQSYLQA